MKGKRIQTLTSFSFKYICNFFLFLFFLTIVNKREAIEIQANFPMKTGIQTMQ